MNRQLSFLLLCLLHFTIGFASTFNLNVEVTPIGAGSLNTGGGTYEEGSSVYLRTYNNTGYVFKGWYESDTLVSSSKSFYYTMPAADVWMQARYEYDPDVPADPNMPDTTTYYNFSTAISPLGAGSVNVDKGKYAGGLGISLRAYTNTGYKFDGWKNGDGELLSTSTNYRFTMPYADTQLTAMYTYDPTVPADPDSMVTRYTLTLQPKPEGSGSFNISSSQYTAGANTCLYSYTHTGYKFVRWEDANGNVLSSEREFYYVMPQCNTTLYGIFEYDPTTPSNPGANHWNAETGEVIMDDYNVGYLRSAIENRIGGSDNDSKVTQIKVSGKMNSNDLGLSYNFPNCTYIDLSRTGGYTAIPSYAFESNSALSEIILPSCVEKIYYYAFYNCSNLSSVTCYATTPPSVGNSAFEGISDGAVLYVPAVALSAYQEADGWKDAFSAIMPITSDVCAIEVNLPAECADGRYKNMTLELVNAVTGQKHTYVINDRIKYVFNGLVKKSSFNAYLRNQQGILLGEIDGIQLQDEDVTVAFTDLLSLYTIHVKVVTPDNADVTQQMQAIQWMDASGNYLSRTDSIAGQVVGTALQCKVTPSQDLGMKYKVPETITFSVNTDSLTHTVKLAELTKVTVTGTVKSTDGSALSNATLSVSQKLNGIYTVSSIAKADNKGAFSIELYNEPTSITAAATDYISKTMEYADFTNGTELGQFALKSITGAVITTNFTYTESVADGETAETQNWYSDYANVAYSIYDKTTGKNITQFNTQYPQIVLLEEVAEGDKLLLTATSKNSSFEPVEAEAVIDSTNRATATFPIVGLGGIKASFTSTDNASVVGLLYDSKGQLMKKYSYSEARLNISSLEDGDYTLVTMTNSTLFNSILNLSQYAAAGLTGGTDYVKNAVTVKSGLISAISNASIPVLDESKLYYTGDATSFTVNKTSITAGNYLTLRGKIDFKDAYASSVSGVKMVVDLPESCSFVENSVMVGSSVSSYTIDGSRITIPLDNCTDQVRFCVIPTEGGDYAPNAFASFKLSGKDIMQPIGSANYEVKNLSISVPSTVAKTSVFVSGTAMGYSAVSVYDGNIIIGQTKALANGNWNIVCTLANDDYLSTHNIYAVAEKQELKVSSEVKVCTYNPYAIRVDKVTMINTAHTSSSLETCEYITTFNFQNPQSISPYWYWPSYPDFTFIVDFTNNDSTLVKDVVLGVKTSSSEIVYLKAIYNKNKNEWIATNKFESNSLPINVSVSYNTLDFETVDTLTIKKELIDNFSSYTMENIECSNGGYSYDLKPMSDGTSLKCYYICVKKDNGGIINKYLTDNTYNVVEKGENAKYYAKSDNTRYAIVAENTDSIYMFIIGNVAENESSQAITRIFSVDYGSDKISESTDPLNRWRDRMLSRAIDEANRKLQCADEIDNIKIHDCIKRLRQGLAFSLGSFLANTINLGNSAGWGGKPSGIIEGVSTLNDVNDAAQSFGDGIEGLSMNAQDALRTLHEIPECGPYQRDNNDDSGNNDSGYVLDPSGYVYEAVETNRLEGVKATCYYKETVEDMYGDKHENIVVWDAKEYAQENPLFTDENGMYRWDVPQGLWQVKFEKDGYETTYSDWLPVPPPQLEVNIAMTQLVQPRVLTANAYENAIDIEFDKYMDASSITAERVKALQDNNAAVGHIVLKDAETVGEQTLVKNIRFELDDEKTSFALDKPVTITVSRRVESYAGKQMLEDFTQEFDVKKELTRIVCDSAITVNYGDIVTIPVTVMPMEVSAGQTLKVSTSSSMILSTEESEMTIDNEGKAYITVIGELPGTSVLTFSVTDSKLTASTIISVAQTRTEIAVPTASVASGSQVVKGTEIYLSTTTEGATIYYTTDGSCPCDYETATVYDGTPIIVNGDVTIKAIAVKEGVGESDIAEFTYIVDITAIRQIDADGELDIAPLPIRDKLNIKAGGRTIGSVSFIGISGVAELTENVAAQEAHINTGKLPVGTYILNIKIGNTTYSKKVVKVN